MTRESKLISTLIAVGIVVATYYFTQSIGPALSGAALRVLILIAVDTFVFLGGYAVLRGLGISVHWVTWIIGGLFMGVSAVAGVLALTPGVSPLQHDQLLGIMAFLVAVYAAGQWATRQGYLRIRNGALPRLKAAVRQLLLFLRRHHQFFGWLVFITATGHAATYLPILSQVSANRLLTGLAAWLTLAGLSTLGLWVERNSRKRDGGAQARFIHSLTALVFFALLVIHV